MLRNLYEPVLKALGCFRKEHGIKISKASLGVAGVVSNQRQYVHLTNASLDLRADELKRKAGLTKVFLMNDFEAIGYAIDNLSNKDIKTIKKAPKMPKAPIAIIGAGTGLGKTLLVYDEKKGVYNPLPSEAHHSDFAAQAKLELELVKFVIKKRKLRARVTNGDILSGNGLEDIYLFLSGREKFKSARRSEEILRHEDKPKIISRFRKTDAVCRLAFDIFKEAYARFAKDCAIDALAYGGVYIAGGIAQKNPDIFDRKFVKVFGESDKMKDVLKKIPVCLITNPDAGLLGAGFAGVKMLR